MKLMEWLNEQELVINDLNLIKQAFIHSSYVNESKVVFEDNERLEFIGDAVLQLLSAKFLYQQIPLLSEGQMTLLRSQLVNEKALATFGRQLKINDHLILGAGELKNGGNERDSNIADAYEALLGALYLDGNLENVDKIFNKSVVPAFLTLETLDVMDYKTKLQEFMQSDTRKTVTYEVISTTGPSNNPTFESVVKMDGLMLGKGKGSSKKRSQQAAAKDALEKLVK
ncbi:MAG: ribonuclease III [Erysipelothrix sp.]|nr:ribonuclease III [Erysipelothrix sp.]